MQAQGRTTSSTIYHLFHAHHVLSIIHYFMSHDIILCRRKIYFIGATIYYLFHAHHVLSIIHYFMYAGTRAQRRETSQHSHMILYFIGGKCIL